MDRRQGLDNKEYEEGASCFSHRTSAATHAGWQICRLLVNAMKPPGSSTVLIVVAVADSCNLLPPLDANDDAPDPQLFGSTCYSTDTSANLFSEPHPRALVYEYLCVICTLRRFLVPGRTFYILSQLIQDRGHVGQHSSRE